MKFAALSLLSFFSAAFLTSTCGGQNPPFQHIIIVLQENRTPDNLFQDLCSTLGVYPCPYNISSQGVTPSGQQIALTPDPLSDDLDPDHSRIPTFSQEYNGGGINQGPSHVYCTYNPNSGYCCKNSAASCTKNGNTYYNWLHFVNNDLFTYNGSQYYRLNPYLQIATQYGWGNYMFQTNQGPSFPAHQFIFGGTSAPGEPPNATFLAENPGHSTFDDDTGCAGSTSSNARVSIIDNTGSESDYAPIIPCVDHPTLSDRIEGASLNWKYYANQEDGIWTAPNAIQHICDPITNPSQCAGSDFTSHVVVGNTGPGQVLRDLGADGLQNCNLQPVSWVIPDGTWSDHGGPSLGYGPAWLSALVNAVGGYYFDSSGQQHSTGCNFWTNTAIFVTWDDWGGWYDHIVPPIVPLNSTQFGSGYLYGFRVPLIVVSAYTPAATVSGPFVSNFNASTFCNPTQQTSIYCHDFGSILKYTETNFALGKIDRTGGGYADSHTMDGQYQGNIPLSEFFTLTTARQFQIIPGPVPASCFITPSDSCFPGYTGPVDPDNDANEN